MYLTEKFINTNIPFVETFDKDLIFYIHKDCEFSRTLVKQVYKTTHDITKADYIVLPNKFNYITDWRSYVKINEEYVRYKWNEHFRLNLEIFYYISNYKEVELYKTYECVKESDFIKNLTLKDRISFEDNKTVIESMLLGKDKNNVKIGMNLLSKCEITKENAVSMLILLNKCLQSIRENAYKTSVEFTTFRKMLQSVSSVDLMLLDGSPNAILKFIKTTDINKSQLDEMINHFVETSLLKINYNIKIKNINIDYEIDNTSRQ